MTASQHQSSLDERLIDALRIRSRDPEARASAVRQALLAGANPNALSTKNGFGQSAGQSALNVAIDNAAPQELQALIDAGASLSPSDPPPARCALERAMRQSPACALVLLNAGADPNTPCSIGGGPLAQAVINGRLPLMDRLIELGARLGSWREQSELGAPFVARAIMGSQFETLAVLLAEHKDQLPDEPLYAAELVSMKMDEEGHALLFKRLLDAARRQPEISSVGELLAASGAQGRDLICDMARLWIHQLADLDDRNEELCESGLEESSPWDSSDLPLTDWLRFAFERHPAYQLDAKETASIMKTISDRKNDPAACLALLEAVALGQSVLKPAPATSHSSARL